MSTGGAQSILFDWGSDGGPDRIVDDGGDATQVIILCDRIEMDELQYYLSDIAGTYVMKFFLK